MLHVCPTSPGTAPAPCLGTSAAERSKAHRGQILQRDKAQENHPDSARGNVTSSNQSSDCLDTYLCSSVAAFCPTDIAGFNEQSQSTAWCERGWRRCISELTVKGELKIPLLFLEASSGSHPESPESSGSFAVSVCENRNS